VTNLSSIQLSSAETSLLSKGLNFIPTGRDLNQVEIISSFDDFVMRLRKSTIHVTKHMDGNTNAIKFTSHRMTEQKPTVYQSPLVEGTLNQIKMALTEINTTQHLRPNLTIEERKALKNLSNNQNLVINSADKSSTVVVQNKEDYIRENLEHLNDQTTYQPLEGDPTDHICQQIKQKLQELKSKGYLSPTMYEFCLPPPKARLARFYSLKKMHKSPPTIRPIVSTCNSPTENISQFLDYWLQPSAKNFPPISKILHSLSEN